MEQALTSCPPSGVDDDAASGDSCETESQEDEDSEGRARDAPDTHMPGGVRLRHARRRLHPRACDDPTRRELLQQMLATKSLLEKKQKNRKSGVSCEAIASVGIKLIKGIENRVEELHRICYFDI